MKTDLSFCCWSYLGFGLESLVCWFLVVGCWIALYIYTILFVVGCWLLVIGWGRFVFLVCLLFCSRNGQMVSAFFYVFFFFFFIMCEVQLARMFFQTFFSLWRERPTVGRIALCRSVCWQIWQVDVFGCMVAYSDAGAMWRHVLGLFLFCRKQGDRCLRKEWSGGGAVTAYRYTRPLRSRGLGRLARYLLVTWVPWPHFSVRVRW